MRHDASFKRSVRFRESRFVGRSLGGLLSAALIGTVLIGFASPASAAGFTTPGTYLYTVPAGVSQVIFDVYGAQGGNGYGGFVSNGPTSGGRGGESKAAFAVTAGQVFEVSVGGQGQAINSAGASNSSGGGAASDVRQGSCTATSSCTLADRIIVAGGGGGAGGCPGANCGGEPAPNGGAGSGTTGAAGTGESDCGVTGGSGATQSAGGGGGGGNSGATGAVGVLGYGGQGGSFGSGKPGGSGGDGYYGGGGGGDGNSTSGCAAGGGGGGSGFITTSANVLTTATGVQAGNGQVVITTLNGTATSVILASSANPSVGDQPVMYTATVSPTVDGGTLTFFDGTTPISGCTPQAVGPSNSVATCSVTYASIGSHAITATYSGDTNNLSSSAHATQVVHPVPSTATALTSAPNPSIEFTQVTYTATVTPTPDGGSVAFKNGAIVIAGCGTQPLAAGVATCTAPSPAPGGYSITATYGGDPSYPLSTSPVLTQTVNVGSDFAVTAPGTYLYTVPAGVVQVIFGVFGAQGGNGGASGGLGGEAKAAVAVTSGQVFEISVGARGQGANSAGGGGASDVRQGSCTATSSCTLADRILVAGGGGGGGTCPGCSNDAGAGGGAGSGFNGTPGAGEPSVCSSPGGGGTQSGGGSAGSGSGGFPSGSPGVLGFGGPGGGSQGNSALLGGSGGDGYYGGGGGAIGDLESGCNASGGGGGSGFITPSANVLTTATGVQSGNGQITITTLSGTATTTALASSANPSLAGHQVTYTATVSPSVDGGTVTFTEGTVPIPGCAPHAVGPSNLSATCSVQYVNIGTHHITATYSGDPNYLSSTATLTQVIHPVPSTTTTLTSSPNPSTEGLQVTYTATVSPTPDAGTVAFSDDSTVIASCTAQPVNSAGVATCAGSFPTPGTHSITAVYGGDQNYPTSTSSVLTQVVQTGSTFQVPGTYLYTVPAGVSQVIFDVYGAQGGNGYGGFVSNGPTSGGRGGESKAAFAVTAGQVFEVSVGGQGQAINSAGASNSSGGGAASDVRQGSCTATSSCTLADRIIVAGGGGGAGGCPGANCGGEPAPNGGAGSGTTGAAGTGESDCGVTGGSGATQSAGGGGGGGNSGATGAVGVLGYGGQGGSFGSGKPGGSGGDGYYGGGGGGDGNSTSGCAAGGGGGGSGFITTSANVLTTATGVQAGNGQVVVQIKPGNPTGLTASAGHASVTLQWTAPTYGGTSPLLGYNVYEGTSPGAESSTPINQQLITSTSDTISSLTDGTTYYFTVAAVNQIGVSGTSNEASATPNPALVITASDVTMPYGTSPPQVIPHYAGFQPGDGPNNLSQLPTCTAAATNTTPAAVYPGGTTCSGAVDPNYTISYVPGTLTVTRDITTTTVTTSASPITTSQSATFTAEVDGGTAPTGTVSFFADGSSTPLAGCANVTLALVSGTFESQCTASFVAGIHAISAVYSGDGNNAGSTSNALTQLVQTVTGTQLVTSGSPSTFGHSVTFTATVTGGTAPTGTVSFFADGSSTALCANVTLALVSGAFQAACTTTGLSVGTHSLVAVYSGDGNNAGSTSSAVSQEVDKVVTGTQLVTSGSPSTFGHSVTFTATVTGGTAPTGTVSFFADGSSTALCANVTLALVSGAFQAACTTTGLSVGTHSLVAVYSGDGNNAGSTSSAVSQEVDKVVTGTQLVTSGSPSTFGHSVTFTATVTGGTAPTGTVSFFADGSSTALCANVTLALVSGAFQAACTTTGLSVGTHSLVAVYSGDGNNAGSTSSAVSQEVDKVVTGTQLVTSGSPSTFGHSVTFTATVTGGTAPTGTVSFFADGSSTALCANVTLALVSGAFQAACTTTGLSVGTHSLVAVYSGDGNNAGSTSSAVSQEVDKVVTGTQLVTSGSPSTFGHSVTFTATVTGGTAPTGTVSFFADGSSTALCANVTLALVSGAFQAACTTTGLSVGTHSLVAVYSGDGNNAGSTSSAVSQEVDKVVSSTALSSSINPSGFTHPVTFTATVTGIGPTGTVSFFADGSNTPLPGCASVTLTLAGGAGTAKCATSSLAIGSHTIGAMYSGDVNNTPSGTTINQTVQPALIPSGSILTAANGCTAYSLTFTTGSSGYSFAITSGSLPSGLVLSSTGTISGTPTGRAGTSTFRVTATGPPGMPTLAQTYLLTVGLCVGPTNAQLPSGTAGTVYHTTLTAQGGTAPYRFQLQRGALPTGLSLSSNGVISGTPSTRGTFTVTVFASDSSNPVNEGEQTLQITIN